MDDKSIKKRMKELREKENMSQLEMAEKLGMSLRSYSSLETGNTRIFNRNMPKFAEMTNGNLKELLFGQGQTKLSEELSEAYDKYKEMHENTVRAYEETLERERILSSEKDKKIETLEEHLRDKEKIIKLLEKQLGND